MNRQFNRQPQQPRPWSGQGSALAGLVARVGTRNYGALQAACSQLSPANQEHLRVLLLALAHRVTEAETNG